MRTNRYRELLGKLGYRRISRFDLLHALHVIAKVTNYPSETQTKQLKHFLGYILKTVDQHAEFYPTTPTTTATVIAGISDAEWAGNAKDRRSVGGCFVYVNSSCILATSKAQGIVTSCSGWLIVQYRCST